MIHRLQVSSLVSSSSRIATNLQSHKDKASQNLKWWIVMHFHCCVHLKLSTVLLSYLSNVTEEKFVLRVNTLYAWKYLLQLWKNFNMTRQIQVRHAPQLSASMAPPPNANSDLLLHLPVAKKLPLYFLVTYLCSAVCLLQQIWFDLMLEFSRHYYIRQAYYSIILIVVVCYPDYDCDYDHDYCSSTGFVSLQLFT